MNIYMSTELLTHSAVYTVCQFFFLFCFLKVIFLSRQTRCLFRWPSRCELVLLVSQLLRRGCLLRPFLLWKNPPLKLHLNEHNHKSEALNTPLPQLSLFCVLEEFAVGMIREEEHTSTAAPGTASIGSEHMRICAPEVIKEVSL